ncbi:MAG: hypothetical protein ACYTE8_11165 [Planctomycetota bacterium]|jgi:uncharacterized cysteine cluster protein YcgN (CxxCxxCC family)
MTNPETKSKKNRQATLDNTINEYVNRLSEEHRMLVVLKSQLYDNNWLPMLDDLKNRIAGKPYIFKLMNRIQDDIERIEEMQHFEKINKVDLTDYIDLT